LTGGSEGGIEPLRDRHATILKYCCSCG
jgi:hypothetical protein